MNLKAKRIYYIRRYKIEMLYNIIPHIKTLDSQAITMVTITRTQIFQGNNYNYVVTEYSTGTHDFKIVFTDGEAIGYTVLLEDWEKLTLSNARTKALWRTRMEDIVMTHVHFNGTGPGDEVTAERIQRHLEATQSAAWGALNVPVYATQIQKREMYKMTKMLMIQLVMMLRDFHNE